MRQTRRALMCTFVVMLALLAPAAISSPALALNEEEKSEVLRIAEAQEGTPYSYGGSSPEEGFDCSGFTQYVFKKADAGNLKRTTGDQMRQGAQIEKDRKRKGDLVFFLDEGNAYHVGIYHSKNRIWHAPSSGKSVELAEIWDSNYVVRRVR